MAAGSWFHAGRVVSGVNGFILKALRAGIGCFSV
jgi:hypothetical protein